jgi:hypothetical protein
MPHLVGTRKIRVGETARYSGNFAEERSGTETNSGPWLSPKSLNSCWISYVPRRRETESRLDGGEGGITRTCGPRPCGVAGCAGAVSHRYAVFGSNPGGFCRTTRLPANKKAPGGAFSFAWRRGWDSNPRTVAGQRFSRPPLSTTQPPLRLPRKNTGTPAGLASAAVRKIHKIRRLLFFAGVISLVNSCGGSLSILSACNCSITGENLHG